MRASSCIYVYTYTPIHVYMYPRPHEYILKEEDYFVYKKEKHYIIIRWKGGKMKDDAVSQCPSQRMDMQ